jgi:lipopolysaccharide assembly protein A
MRFIKFVLLMLFFLFFMVFFVQNNDQLSTALELKFHLFNLKCQSQPIPFFIIVLLFFVAGALLSTIIFIIDRLRLGSKLSSAESKIRGLESDLSNLRSRYPSVTASAPSGESGS